MTVAASQSSPVAAAGGAVSCPNDLADRLVQSRLGVYAGLFYALRAKHPPTAAHGLRVALVCSKWAVWNRFDLQQRHLLEVAALLHDMGKIAIPDRVLQKSTQLDSEEHLLMELQTTTAVEILLGAGAAPELIEIVRQARVAYEVDSTLQTSARMLAIVDAFDSMTTEQVFRKALSRERAVDELFRFSGSQFDPQLIDSFAEMIKEPRPKLEVEVAKGWLSQVAAQVTPGFSPEISRPAGAAVQNLVDTVFHQRLLQTLPDAAIYLDTEGQILCWNRAAERITGRRAEALIHHRWTSQLMGLLGEDGEPLPTERCPLDKVLNNQASDQERLQIRHVDGSILQVQLSSTPVLTAKGGVAGAILVVRDASAQVHLEARVQSLNAMASQDNLTKVSNRAELDRRLPSFLQVHTLATQPGSLIICDIDHFKRINDTCGHQAGDEALVIFASVLRECSREGDLVARYGGEEFVVLCVGCDNPTATARAEEIRRMVERTPVPSLRNNTLTASFGVTEIQPGDSAATILARADRALLLAKETGRNRVVQLGTGHDPDALRAEDLEACDIPGSGWLNWFRPRQEFTVLRSERLASVPHSIAIQKLEGFISDHGAEILQAEPFHIVLRINSQRAEAARRHGERQASMIIDLAIKPVDYQSHRGNTYQSATKLDIVIRTVNPRDRRQTALLGQANQLLFSVNSYLMSQVITDSMRPRIGDRR